MEQAFLTAWLHAREQAKAMGVRLRPMDSGEAMKLAHRSLSSTRESDGFFLLAQKGKLQWSLEALVVDKRFTALFSDEEVNNALTRLLTAGYRFL